MSATPESTRSLQPFLLVNTKGEVVGYAESTGPRVQARARRLGATIIRNPNRWNPNW